MLLVLHTARPLQGIWETLAEASLEQNVVQGN